MFLELFPQKETEKHVILNLEKISFVEVQTHVEKSSTTSATVFDQALVYMASGERLILCESNYDILNRIYSQLISPIFQNNGTQGNYIQSSN